MRITIMRFEPVVRLLGCLALLCVAFIIPLLFFSLHHLFSFSHLPCYYTQDLVILSSCFQLLFNFIRGELSVYLKVDCTVLYNGSSC